MLQEIIEFFEVVLGFGADELTWYQMGLRAILVYILTLVMVRVGEKRFLGKSTAFDVILGFVLGSTVSGAITGNSSFFGPIVAGFVLVWLHWGMSAIAFRSDRFGDLVKGRIRKVVDEGEIKWDEMEQSNLSKQDLMSGIRKEANQNELEDIKKVYLERSGELSVIPVPTHPKILEIKVEEGVQTIRIQLE